METTLAGNLEPWKWDLIKERVRHGGISKCDREDADQECVVAVLQFQFDPAKAHGASERTALCAVINNTLVSFKRARHRAKARTERYLKLPEARRAMALDFAQLEKERALELGADVAGACAALPELEQSVCNALSQGLSEKSITSKLGITRHKLTLIKRNIKESLEQFGLREWVV